jgi:TrmH family RNA methyltransferase
MLSKNTIKLIKSLAHKKYRQKHQLFLVEGDKNVIEVLDSRMIVKSLFATSSFLSENESLAKNAEKIEVATNEEIKKASLLKSPQNSLAICLLPKTTELPQKPDPFSFYLDGIQDPGNLGTIIRTCDWFGIENLYCSEDTADVFNPKVIQATMGSFTRVKINYTGLNELKEMARTFEIKIIGSFMDGNSIYKSQLPEKALVILGNEGKGIRKEAEQSIEQRISIPRFHNKNKPESLNVAATAAIICSEFKRVFPE